jgi:hypothetical protein
VIQRLPEPDSGSSKAPYHRPNDSWVQLPASQRAEGSHGENGELTETIVKKPSLRVRRRNFTAACTAFTIGMIFIICSSPFGKEFLVPGPLSSHHAPLLANESSERCAKCHANANGSLVSWIAGTFVSASKAGLSQSELCMKCHDESLVENLALNPHNVDTAELNLLSSRYKRASLDAGMLFHQSAGHQKEIACSACHREHHGAKELTRLTDSQCQTCHSNSYHSFELDHPEFTNWPQERRSRIAFDHSTHASQHFPGKQQRFDCNQCHVDDAFRNVKKLASFEQSCAECHNQQILDSGAEGLALIALPMIDTQAIEAAQLDVGNWPLAATGDFDGQLPPMMRVMLAADPQANEILFRHGADFDFSDFDPTHRPDVEDAVNLIWSIKRLLYDLSLNGPAAVRSRLENVLGFAISDAQLQRIITNLDEPVFQNAVQRWLPNLPAEVAIHRFGKPAAGGLTEKAKTQLLAKSKIDWWPTRSETVLQIADDRLLLANNPLAGLLQPLSSPVEEAEMPIVRVPNRGSQRPLADSPPAGDDQPSDSAWRRNAHGDPAQDPQLLAINPLKKLMRIGEAGPESDLPLPKVKTPPPPIAGLKNISDVDVEESAKVPVESQLSPVSTPIVRKPLIVPSGWFRNDSTFQISYRPRGHADDCLQSWIELVTQATDADTRVETKQLFEKTISMTGIGLCRTCHTVDQLPDRSFAVNWRAEYRDPSIRSFTKFAHGPHLLQPELQDCSQCHELDPLASNKESFLDIDSKHVVSNFLPIRKSDCASCHQSGRTSNSCTQCHNYHVGSQVIGSK